MSAQTLRFHATCNLTKKVREERLDQAAINQFRNAGYRRELVLFDVNGRKLEKGKQYWVWCLPDCDGFVTGDPAALEAHIAEHHRARLSRADGENAPFSRSIRSGWRPPRLKPAGQPFVDKAGVTQVCPDCGLVAEVGGPDGWRATDALWWREHLERCTGTRVVAS